MASSMSSVFDQDQRKQSLTPQRSDTICTKQRDAADRAVTLFPP